MERSEGVTPLLLFCFKSCIFVRINNLGYDDKGIFFFQEQ